MAAIDRMDLLETFVRIVETGSLANAARDFDVEPSTISRKLTKLEEHLKQPLINRSTHEFSLTDEGQRFFREATELISHWQRMEERYRSAEVDLTGLLKIVAPVGMGQHFMTDVAVDFQRQHPGINLTWILQDEPVRFAEVGCDLWIRLGDEYDETLVNHKLAITRRTLVASPSFVKGVVLRGAASVEKLRCVALDPIDGGKIELTSTTSKLSRTIYPDVVMSTNNFYAMHRGVINGLGFGVLPYWFVEQDILAGRLVELSPEWEPRSLSVNAAYLPGRYQSQRIGLFIEHLSSALRSINGIRAISTMKVASLSEMV